MLIIVDLKKLKDFRKGLIKLAVQPVYRTRKNGWKQFMQKSKKVENLQNINSKKMVFVPFLSNFV